MAKSRTPVRWLIIAAEPVSSVDVTAADTVVELDEALYEMDIELCFAEQGSCETQAETTRPILPGPATNTSFRRLKRLSRHT